MLFSKKENLEIQAPFHQIILILITCLGQFNIMQISLTLHNQEKNMVLDTT